jgi:hypothetical protein
LVLVNSSNNADNYSSAEIADAGVNLDSDEICVSTYSDVGINYYYNGPIVFGGQSLGLMSHSCEETTTEIPAVQESLACPQCLAGTYSNGTTSCRSCDAGQYQPAAGQSSCLACDPGTYSRIGASGCTTCQPGTYATVSGCLTCASGKYSNAKKTSCIAWSGTTDLLAGDTKVTGSGTLEGGYTYKVVIVGGGGGGGGKSGGTGNDPRGGGGGGGGGEINTLYIRVPTSSTYAYGYAIGAGGGRSTGDSKGGTGYATEMTINGTKYIAKGGDGGTQGGHSATGSSTYGGTGGTSGVTSTHAICTGIMSNGAGGAGATIHNSLAGAGGAAGSNGSNGTTAKKTRDEHDTATSGNCGYVKMYRLSQ